MTNPAVRKFRLSMRKHYTLYNALGEPTATVRREEIREQPLLLKSKSSETGNLSSSW